MYVRMCELWTSSQAPKSGTAKPNNLGKSAKALNSPIYSTEEGDVVSLL